MGLDGGIFWVSGYGWTFFMNEWGWVNIYGCVGVGGFRWRYILGRWGWVEVIEGKWEWSLVLV